MTREERIERMAVWLENNLTHDVWENWTNEEIAEQMEVDGVLTDAP